MQSTDLTAALVVPFLYARGSFSYACRWLATVTAAATIVWQLFAKAKPSDLAGAPAAALPKTAAGGGSAARDLTRECTPRNPGSSYEGAETAWRPAQLPQPAERRTLARRGVR